MARATLEWKNLPTEGMPKPIATAYTQLQEANAKLKEVIEKHMAKKLDLDLSKQEVVISTRRGLGYAVKARGTGATDGEW